MLQNRPWVVIYMHGNTDRGVRALMYKINNEFPLCNIGAIVDLDKPGLDMMKSLMIPTSDCPNAEKVFCVDLVRWIGVLPSTIVANNNFARRHLPQGEANLIRDNIRDGIWFYPNGCNANARAQELDTMINQRIKVSNAHIPFQYWHANIDNLLNGAI